MDVLVSLYTTATKHEIVNIKQIAYSQYTQSRCIA